MTAKIHYVDLWGTRERKYDWLLNTNVIEWTDLKPHSPFYLFNEHDADLQGEYDNGWKVTDVFPINSIGIATGRDDLTVSFDKEETWETVTDFAAIPTEKARTKYQLGDDSRDWQVALAQRDLKSTKLSRKNIVPILYRPFDKRFTYYTGKSRGFHCMPRGDVMSHVLEGKNLGLSMTRSLETARGWEHVFCSNQIIQMHTVSLKEVNYLFPLYLYHPVSKGSLFDEVEATDSTTSRRSNISALFINDLTTRLGFTFTSAIMGDGISTFGAQDILHYFYAVLHSPAYRSRYAAFLKVDFPHIQLTSDAKLFRKLCVVGADLVALHLLEDDYEAASWNQSKYEGGRMRDKSTNPLVHLTAQFKGSGTAEVAKGYPKYKDGKVYINPSRYLQGVREEVWKFHVGGYQVCEKWLKDRRLDKYNQALTDDDVTYYQHVIVAVDETIRLMAEIDRLIEEHGGWPLAGSQDAPKAEAASALPFA